MMVLVQTTLADMDKLAEIWNNAWSVRRSCAVDANALVRMVLIGVIGLYQAWMQDERGRCRGEWRYNELFYKQFGRAVRLLGMVQEILYNYVDQEGVNQECKICMVGD